MRFHSSRPSRPGRPHEQVGDGGANRLVIRRGVYSRADIYRLVITGAVANRSGHGGMWSVELGAFS